MVSFRTAKVLSKKHWNKDVVLLEIELPDGKRGTAIAYKSLTGDVDSGDEVVVNTTAVELGLGSGGYHFALWNLRNKENISQNEGHIMKLRYTPLQISMEVIEEKLGYTDENKVLKGMPVIAGELHSQLMPAVFGFKSKKPSGKIVYIMTDGGALPLQYSETVKFLEDKGYIDASITCGNAFGGDIEAINIYGALEAAKRILCADMAIVVMGPGIVGTGSTFGFSGIEQGIILNAAFSMGGVPIAIPRIMFNDSRARHYGLSHHTITVLKVGTLARVIVPVPVMDGKKARVIRGSLDESGISKKHIIREVDSKDVLEMIEKSGFIPSVMGRKPNEEPEFFMTAAASGIVAAEESEGNERI
ncbi:MAG: DUF3866 family protein [Actinomycetota bacterium]|nr:DUF3866 family protein [Actinomycetota bacterium]